MKEQFKIVINSPRKKFGKHFGAMKLTPNGLPHSAKA